MSDRKLGESADIVRRAVTEFNPTHIVSMVSGGKDSAASDQVARELGLKIDLVVHGNTRCGIPQTSQFVADTYGSIGGSDYVEADAGTAYEDYVLRKGFFGMGIGAHGFAYRVLKAHPFRKAISKAIRQGKRGVRILLLNGARQDESENRQKNLAEWRQDPAAPGNIWTSLIHGWSQDDRDEYLQSRGTPINPVAEQLCRSGECMCGTMQTKGERAEASVLYPAWVAGLMLWSAKQWSDTASAGGNPSLRLVWPDRASCSSLCARIVCGGSQHDPRPQHYPLHYLVCTDDSCCDLPPLRRLAMGVVVMKDPMPVNLDTPETVRANGWQAECRDVDGHLTRTHAPFASDEDIVWLVREALEHGDTITIWPVKS